MKKLLLSIACAIFGISASLATVPAGQSPAEKRTIPPTQPSAQWQTAPQQPVVQGKNLKGLAALSGTKAVAHLNKMNPAKAPAQAAEATAADLVIMDETALAATVLQQNADFTAETTIRNNGTSDYEGTLQAYLFYESTEGLVPFFATDPVPAAIPQGTSQPISIPGYINGDEIPAGGYYIGIAADGTELIDFEGGEYNLTYVEILPDPEQNFILNVTDEAEFPATLTQDKDGTMAVTIANAGHLPFEGYIVMGLSLDGNGLHYVSNGISTRIAGQSSQQVEIPYNVPSNLPATTYQLSIFYYIQYDGSFYYIPLSDGTYYKYVEVAANPDNFILNVANEPALPETLNQNANGTLAVNIENTGNLAFDGSIAMALVTADNTLAYATAEVKANIAGQSSQQMEIPYYIPGTRIAAGTYRMAICHVEGTTLHYIPLPGGAYYKEIEIIETEEPALSLDEGAAFPESIMKEAEFAVSGTITNTGADFDGTIGLLLADWNGNTYYESEHQDANIARNASLPFEIKGKVGADTELPGTEIYVLYIVTGNYETIGFDIVSIAPNPTLEPILSWATTHAPESILQSTELTVEGAISNAGTAFSGQLCAALTSNEDNNIAYMTERQEVNVASNGSTPFTATGNIGTLTPGEYTLQVLHYDGNRYNIIGDCGNVTVEANPEISPVLSWVGESSDIPAFVYQGIPFAVKAMIKNDGATFSGPVSLQISSLTALIHSDEQNVTIAKGETKEVTFSNIVISSELNTGYYLLNISTEAGELYSGTISLQDAPTTPMLSVTESLSEIPATIMQNQEFTLKAMVRNDGLAFGGNLHLLIQSSAAEEVFSMQQAATIAPGETKEVVFIGTITDETPAGNYYLSIYEEGNEYGFYAKDIRLVEDRSGLPMLSLVEEGSNIPAILYHGREFTATTMLRNDGTDFDGTLRMHITYYGMEKPRDFDPFGQTGLSPLATI